ncbi:phage tail assembly protein [Pseudomonas aeruginosa]|uniref:phage tail assembly protein n=1 Tax=Pseudomonas aeruginosa TaxID=287 RepID=UPI001CD267B6|nr:phage tail assembly protein [Pseudomonas aeruginosa]MDP5917467.1 phage tail assembly protein [Pseudomonas aeruginosa]MDU0742757.1 phage tail assembly protein [Pseudomonas aeruginosa]MDU0753302.1 phage tail assembly protein [Pseudomonas aeruginosa]MDY1382887.1 phage tail assembly protein [Pseudomonas aeruginosa]HBO9264138.1 phage tail assembly protein [Pseudomonas aeruginosa]
MTTPEQSTATSNPNESVVPLDKPIARGANTIDSLTLRKPASGELRGVSLLELMQMDVQALSKVLPRITSPSLTPQEVSAMDPADLMACGVTVSGFLLQKSAKEASLVA